MCLVENFTKSVVRNTTQYIWMSGSSTITEGRQLLRNLLLDAGLMEL